jgi:glycosyltransferase involved in cell wall biosynthesis
MKHIKETKGRLIGQGGRTEDLKKIDKYLSLIKESSLNNIDGEYLWKKVMFNLQSLLEENKSYGSTNTNVIFTGRVSKKQLIKEYANALCVVCPSYEEDYGLTAIEAMAFRKPVIACKDGGGYLEFIKDGKNGFIVEPTGEAIAEKIKYLKDNPDKLREMGQNAFEFSRKYSWDNAIKSLNNAIQRFIRRKN